MSDSSYWDNLKSNALIACKDRKKYELVEIIRSSDYDVDFCGFDASNPNIEYWNICLYLKHKDYKSIEKNKEEYQKELGEIFFSLSSNSIERTANVFICQSLERYIDWQAILPETKETVINLIKEEYSLLKDVATGKSYKVDGLEDLYIERHRFICKIAKVAGFDYPIKSNTLPEWWVEIKKIEGYAARRSYIDGIFIPLLNELVESEDDSDDSELDFSSMENKSDTIDKALNEAREAIAKGKYDSAFDRIHTAFKGYIEILLNRHKIEYSKDDQLTSSYGKLVNYYENSIKPDDVAKRVKTILRGGSGIVNSINEIRNNNTIAHPNEQLIKESEAKLAISIIESIVNYIEDIEKSKK